MNPILSFSQLSFGYRESRLVLDQLSLDFERGSITALLGPNGAGKTTLLHLALGWLQPKAGLVLLEGRPLTDYSRSALGRRIGLIPQSETITFDFSVLEYVLLGRAPYIAPLAMPGDADLAAAYASLERVGMQAFANRSMREISGGERQLALVARALAQQPHILLLDEPTAHLDLGNKARLIRLLTLLQQQGVTLLLTTHDPELAALLSTHIVMINQGQVLANGTAAEVLTPQNLSRLYGLTIDIADLDGRKVILWQ